MMQRVRRSTDYQSEPEAPEKPRARARSGGWQEHVDFMRRQAEKTARLRKERLANTSPSEDAPGDERRPYEKSQRHI
jgi:hypothetical protein